jgi:hypothetical protein
MNRVSSTRSLTQTWMTAVLIFGCGDEGQQSSSDAGRGPDCSALMDVSGDSCQPFPIGAHADAGLDGEGTADARGSGWVASDSAAAAATDGDAQPDADDSSADATDVASGDARGTSGDAGGASDASAGGAGVDVVLSGKCSNGIVSVASDVFNPGDVYLDGTLTKAECGRDALTHWSDPNSACTGFDCNFDGASAVIRPTDGRIIYVNTFENALREFHADSCPMPPMSAYPSTPLANDTIIRTPKCPTDAGSNSGVAGYVMSPEGDIYYHCYTDTVWYDLAGNAVYDESNGYDLLKVARGGAALVAYGGNTTYKWVNLATGVFTDVGVQALLSFSIFASRALDTTGLWIAIGSPASDDVELWEIHPDGTSIMTGSYSPSPTGSSAGRGACALDGCGALLQFGRDPTSGNDTIVRRQVHGTTQVVYDDGTMPLVTIWTPHLITGP